MNKVLELSRRLQKSSSFSICLIVGLFILLHLRNLRPDKPMQLLLISFAFLFSATWTLN
jgi:hypothetical protein